MNTLLNDLRIPFPPEAITWKPGHATKDGAKCLAMAYGDLRVYQERLDRLCGLDWSVAYEPWGGDRIICRLTIGGVTRSSTGEMSDQDEKNGMGGTVAEAQAFKRAAAAFGLGRYLYELPSVWVGYDSAARKISKEGQAELDRRYRTWYDRTMAAQAPQPAQAVPSTGEIITTPPDRVLAEENGDVLFAKPEPATLSDAQLKRLNIVGHKFYGDEWDVRRHKLTEAATRGRTLSSKELTPDEAEKLIAGIEKRQREADIIIAQRAQQAAPTPA